jgi:hypothetical protein
MTLRRTHLQARTSTFAKFFVIVVLCPANVCSSPAILIADTVDTVKVRVQGKFGGYNDQISNLPPSTYPLPQLFGGSFHGEFSYKSDAFRDFDRRFPFESVDISVFDNQGGFLHRIDSGPNAIRVGNGEIAFNFGESAGMEAVNTPEDLRIMFTGAFSFDDERPPTLQALSTATFTPFYSFIEVDGPTAFTFWDVDVVSATIAVVPEPSAVALAELALLGVGYIGMRRVRSWASHMGELNGRTKANGNHCFVLPGSCPESSFRGRWATCHGTPQGSNR